MEILDVGGGFAGNQIGNNIAESLKYTKNDSLKCKFIAEPGRFITSRPFAMCVRVIGKRQISKNHVALYINDGIYHAFNKVSTDGVSLNGKRLFFNDQDSAATETEIDQPNKLPEV